MSGLRTGYTTGACAAAAAKAAVLSLLGHPLPDAIEIGFPDGTRANLPLAREELNGTPGRAAVRKDAGDDPDVTDRALIVANVSWAAGSELTVLAGDGVGTVTKPGLAVPPGEPAINPVPRRMIHDAIREITDRGVEVTISIPGGAELASKTFNPRLGVEGGLSILGTSGIVRPFSTPALRDALKCALSVARACDVRAPVFVPGRIGDKAARRHFEMIEEQVIEVSNEWGFMLDLAAAEEYEALLALGHPGKLAKLAQGQWDTHSKRSDSAVPLVAALARDLFGAANSEAQTVEAVLMELPPQKRSRLSDTLADRIREAIHDRVQRAYPCAVVLVNLKGDILGSSGDLDLWNQ